LLKKLTDHQELKWSSNDVTNSPIGGAGFVGTMQAAIAANTTVSTRTGVMISPQHIAIRGLIQPELGVAPSASGVQHCRLVIFIWKPDYNVTPPTTSLVFSRLYKFFLFQYDNFCIHSIVL